MAHSLRTLRLVSASALALLMVAGTYLATGPNPFFGIGRIAEAQTSEELLREYASKDTDTDGLPDWQEALYGTDPTNRESFQAGISDGEAVAQGLIEPKVAVRPDNELTDLEDIPGVVAPPSSLTDQFARTLLSKYLLNRQETPPTQEELLAFIQGAVADLNENASVEARYTQSDLVAGGSGADAVAAYAAAAESVFVRIAVPVEKNELFYFSDAVRGETTALKEISSISETYAAIAAGLMEVPVPAEARQAHLAIANAIYRLSVTSADMAAMENDPLRALLGISMHSRHSQEWVAAFANMSAVFKATRVTVPESAAGYSFIETSDAAAAAK